MCRESKMLTVIVSVRKKWELQVESPLETASETWMRRRPIYADLIVNFTCSMHQNHEKQIHVFHLRSYCFRNVSQHS